jgi:hypothetical protein
MRRLLPFVLLAGCSWTTYQRTNPAPHELVLRGRDHVEILKGPPAMGRAYVEIGVFDVADSSYAKPPGEDPKVADILRDKGAKHGCDAVEMESQNHIDDGLSTRDIYRARCLVWQ